MASNANSPLPSPSAPRPPPRIAILSGALFSGSCATIAAIPAWGPWPRWFVVASNPLLFAVGLILGAALARRRLTGSTRSLALPWVLTFAGLAAVGAISVLPALARSLGTGGNMGALATLIIAVLSLLLVLVSVLLGVAFGWATHALSRKLADRLRETWMASSDPAQLAATSVPWLAGVAVAKCAVSPLSWLGSSATLAAAFAAWLAWRGGRRAAAAACCLLAVATVSLKVWGSLTSDGPSASGGMCNLTNCSGACVDLDTDPSHCGLCTNVCGPGLVCKGGECSAPGSAP